MGDTTEAGPGSTNGSSFTDDNLSKTSNTTTTQPAETTRQAAPGGVIAGAAVGAAVGAAILTFLITFMFLRKKSQEARRRGKHKSGSGDFSTHADKTLPEDPTEGNNVVLPALAWQKHLPQSADDQTIRSAVKTLFDQVELHVENFYRDSAVAMTESLQAELLRVDSPHLSASIVTLLPQAQSQTALIKHCLVSYIVASISTDDNSVQSLLPAEFSTLPRLARVTRAEKAGFNQALSQWRVLCVYLRPTPKNDQTYLSQRDANVTAAATAFNDAFTPWARSAYSDSARRQNVAEIFKSAADVGILIFSQRSSFAYQWQAAKENRSGSSLVVTPAFLKVADENANLLDRPQTMIKMTTQSI